MHTYKPILIIGHSHVACIQSALDTGTSNETAQVINLREITEAGMTIDDVVDKLRASFSDLAPQAVCLSIGGNFHNALGVVENPVPFSIGDKDAGAVPRDPTGRQFIPSAVMEDLFIGNYDNVRMEKLYDAFPSARRLYLNSPPPISSFEHIQNNPGIFRDKLHLGPSPAALRLKLYQLQTKIIRRFVEAQGALFINPKQELIDEEGFLLKDYFNNDPTHGNTAYGKVMLKEILINAGPER